MSDHYDAAWKEMLESHFPDFLAFFFPKIHRDIDWSRGYHSLEQELHQVAPQAELGLHVVDKLIRLWRKGDERFFLIHVEIQSEYDVELPRRMFTYNYRAFDLHQCPVVSLAVLGDDRTTWRSTPYVSELYGCEVRLEFLVLKLKDYNARWAELEASRNPFAVVVMAHLKTRATRRDPEERFRWKKRLIHGLYEREWTEAEFVELFTCVDRMLQLPAELGQRFWHELREYEKEKCMPYVSSVEQIGYERGIKDGVLQGMKEGEERGLQQGLRKGIERGLRKGIERGVRQGEAKALARLLVRRFDALPLWAETLLENASLEQLARWFDRAVDAERLEDVFAAP